MTGALARALYADGRTAEGETWAARGAELDASDDPISDLARVAHMRSAVV